MKYIQLLLVSILPYTSLSAISMVYNIRIAQITKEPILGNTQQHRHFTLTVLPFDVYQRKYTDTISHNFAGGLGSFMYNCNPYFLRIDAAVSHIHERIQHKTIFRGSQTDDILFTVGRSFRPTEHTGMELSGLLGIPTHSVTRLKHVDFGSDQVGLGIQYDGLYTFCPTNTLLYAARYIYFIPRDAHDNNHNTYKLTIGNSSALLIAYKKTWGKHALEIGYTPQWQFGAHINPALDDVARRINYIRSSLYLDYDYTFLINTLPNRLIFNISYGRDHTPKLFGNKYIITLWAAWSVNF